MVSGNCILHTHADVTMHEEGGRRARDNRAHTRTDPQVPTSLNTRVPLHTNRRSAAHSPPAPPVIFVEREHNGNRPRVASFI